jgi:ATP-binding cassette subfamily B protein
MTSIAEGLGGKARAGRRDAGDAAAKPTLSALRPFAGWLARHKARIAMAVISLAIASAATLVIPVAVRRVIDGGFVGGEAGLIDSYFGALFGVVAVLAVASSLRYYFVTTLGERVVADIREDLFRRLVSFDVAFFDDARSGELISRLSADTTQLKSAFGVSASIALRNMFLFVGATVMMIVTSPGLSLLVGLAIPLIVLPLVGAGRTVRRRAKAAQDQLAEATAYATEQIGAIRAIKSFSAEPRIAGRYAEANREAYEAARATVAFRSALSGVAIFLIFASIIAVLWYGASAVADGVMSAGELSQFLLYALFAAGGLSQLSEVWTELSAAAGSAERLGELLAVTPAIASRATKAAAPPAPFRSIAFEDVSFAYPARPGEPILGPVSFRVADGERLAVVGPSGAGKSTIIQLAMRFYDPSAGRLLAGDRPYASLDPDDLRASIALVPQDPVIFAASIAENIRYARPDADDRAVEAAAEQAAALDFIRALPQGFATPVGERGVTLSGGQRQRIAIARAILKDAPILLLDEATSALDAESEAQVQEALTRLSRGRTSIVIAHRLATIVAADRILVLDRGRIVAEGRHEALIAQGGLYARLAALQFAKAEDAR